MRTPRAIASVTSSICLTLLAGAIAPGRRTAETFVAYWNEGDVRAEMNRDVFAEEFIARRGPDGLRRIMEMVYRDNGDIAIHSITSSDAERVRFLVSSQKGNWLEVSLDLATDGKIAGMGIGFTTAPPPGDDKGLSTAQIAARLEKHMNDLAANGEFSGSVLLAKGGEPLFAKAFGLANIESGRKNTLDTPINLGSMNNTNESRTTSRASAISRSCSPRHRSVSSRGATTVTATPDPWCSG